MQGYIKKLKEFVAKPTPGTTKEDIKIKQIALRTNINIQVCGLLIRFILSYQSQIVSLQAMIRDLFHSPPIYKANITLSFKPEADKSESKQPKVGDKRKPITFGEEGGKKRQLYMDVVGKKQGNGAARARNGIDTIVFSECVGMKWLTKNHIKTSLGCV